MKRLSLCYWFSQLTLILFIFQLLSCKKTDEIQLNHALPHRIVETLHQENGINHFKDQYYYHQGKLLLHYGYEWNDVNGWEKSSRSIYVCWLNNFMSTEYVGTDSNWVPTREIRAKFVDGKPIEVIYSEYGSDTMLMLPGQKWKFTYSNERIRLCELQSFDSKGWISFFKTENIYIGDQLVQMKSYGFDENDWVLESFADITYKNKLVEYVSWFRIHNKEWLLDEKYEFQYSGQILSRCSCYRPCFKGDSLYLDCTTQFRYDENNELEYECCSGHGNMIEKFYAYEDSCGNYGSTMGEICSVLNFPLELPVPVKASGMLIE